MKLNKKQGEFLTQTIDQWLKDSVISTEEAERLKGSYAIRPFDWKQLAKYSFWVAIACGVIAFGSLVADDLLLELVEKFFSSSDIAVSVVLGLIATGVYAWGMARRKAKPEQVFSNEALLFVGVFFTAASIAYLGKALDTGSGNYSLLLLFSTIVYGFLGLWFPSVMVWVFALLSLGSWFGTSTGYFTDWDPYFLGMNYFMRFVLFGGLLIGASFLMRRLAPLKDFSPSTYVAGLLYFFIAFWLLSIFGNHDSLGSWSKARQLELLPWGILFGLAAVAAIVYGLKQDDETSRHFGITFLFINLYTRFFEFFWDFTHKAIFFSILAFSFWLLGRKAESIWNLEFLQNDETESEAP